MHRVFLVLCCVVAVLVSGCASLGSELRFAAEDFIDMQAEPSGIYTVRMGHWTTDVPADTRLEVDVRHDYQVQLVTGNTRLGLGKLQQQLPDTPVKTMFLDTGTTRFILGWVDDEVEGTPRSVLVSRAASDEEPRPVNGATIVATFSTANGSRLFFVPIEAWENPALWDALQVLNINTYESMAKNRETNYRAAVEKEFVPPFAIGPLYQRINLAAK